MKRWRKGLWVLVLAPGLTPPAAAQEAGRWDVQARVSRFEDHLGRRALFVQQGYAYLRGASLADGTLEVDAALPIERTFAGVTFRVRSPDEREEFYLRPHKSGLEDAMQYQPVINGATTWQLFNGTGFTGAVEIPRDRWFHLRIELRGWEARIFVDGAETPTLVIPELQHDYAAGGIGVWGGPAGAWFADLRYQPLDTAPPGPKEPRAMDPRILRTWELSPAFDADDSLPTRIPANQSGWEAVVADATGMLLIDRYRRSTGVLPPSVNFARRLDPGRGRRLVFARTVIESDREQLTRLSVGYSDELVVFLNGNPLFQGRSAWRFRDETALGIVNVENDAVYLPLRRGRNELVLAVGEYFGGWGLIARIDDLTGLRLKR